MIGAALALCLVMVAGFGTVALVAGRTRLQLGEWLGLSFLAGGGVISVATWLFGLVLSGWDLRWAVTLLALVLGFLGWRRGRENFPCWEPSPQSRQGIKAVAATLGGTFAFGMLWQFQTTFWTWLDPEARTPFGSVILRAIAIVTVTIYAARKFWPRDWRKWPLPTRHDAVLLGVASVLIGYAAWLAPRAAFSWDALMTWEAKSFIAFQNGGALPADYFADRDRIFTWPFYPLYLSYLQSWIYGWVGAPDQSALCALPAFFLGSAALLMGGVLRRVGAPLWLAATAMAGWFTIPYAFSGVWGMFSGYADFPMGVLFFSGVWAAVWWQESREPAALRFLALLGALLPWVKREGQYLLAALLLVPLLLLLRQRRWRDMAVLTMPALTLVLGWNLYLSRCHVVTDPTFHSISFAVMQERIGPIFSLVGAELVRTPYWSFLWPLAGVALVALGAGRRWVLAGLLACALIVPLLVAVGAYMCSTWDYALHASLSLERLVLQLAPVALLTIAVACPWRPAPARETMPKVS